MGQLTTAESPRKRLEAWLLGCLLCASISAPWRAAYAAEDMDAAFRTHGLSAQFVTGPMFAARVTCPHVYIMDFWQLDARLGWMLNQPGAGSSLLRGNFEALLELAQGYIFKGAGNYMVGLTAQLRYNFVQPRARWVPYAQVGIGFVSNDVYKADTQNAIGNSVEFTPQASLGLHYFLNPGIAVGPEVIFQHISNASLAKRNDGVNVLGGFFGFTLFLGS